MLRQYRRFTNTGSSMAWVQSIPDILMKRKRQAQPRLAKQSAAARHIPQHAPEHLWRGALLLLLSLVLFSGMDTTIKYLAMRYNAPMVVALRFVVHFLLMLLLLGPIQGRRLLKTQRTGLVWVRAVIMVATSLCMGLALRRMPVAETSAINFLAPMVVVLLARPLLGERIGWLGWLAAITGFSGVLLIVRPGGGALDPVGVIYALGGMSGGAAYQLLSRVLAKTETTSAMLFYVAMLGAVCMGSALPWLWPEQNPAPQDMALFVAVGAAGGLGHYLFTAAFRHAPASFLAPLNYLQLIWATWFGWLAFGHMPDELGLLGMGVVMVSGMMIALKPRRPKSAGG